MNAGTIIAQLQLNADNFRRGINDASRQLGDFSGAAGMMAKGVAAGVAAVGVAAVGLGVVFTKVAIDQDNAATKMQMATGATAEEMTSLNEVADSLFEDGLGNYDEAYDALTQVKTQLGETGDFAGEAAAQALTLSKAFGFDVKDSIRAVSGAVKNFGVDYNQANDMVTALAQQAGDKADDLLDTFTEYSPIVSQMGLSFEDFGDIMAKGMEQGVFNFDKMGDALKEFNIRTMDGSKTTVAAFQDLGFNADEMAAKFGQGGEQGKQAFDEVMKSLKGIKDPLKQNEIGVSLFGSMWEDLGSKVVLSMGEATGTLKNVEGATARVGETLEASFGNKMERVKNQFLSFGADVMEAKVLPILSKLADWVLANMPMIEAVVGTTFDVLGTVIGGLVTSVTALIGFMTEHQTLITTVAGIIAAVLLPALIGWVAHLTILRVQAIATLVPAMIGWIASNYALGISFLAAYAPIILIVAGIALLVAGIVWVIKNWDDVKKVTLAVWNAIKSFLLLTWNAIKAAGIAVWDAMKAAFTATWNAIKAVGEAIWNGLKIAFMAVFDAIKWYFTTVLGIYKTIFTVAWNAIKAVAIAVWNGIKASATAIWNAIKASFSTVWNAIAAIFTNVSNGITSKATALWNLLKNGFGDAINFVKGTFTGLYDNVMGSLTKLIGGIKNKVMQAKEWMTELNPFKRHSPSLVDNVLAGVKQIKDTYASVSGMEVTAPTIGNVSPGHFTGGMFEGEGGGSASAGGTNYNAPLVQVANMTVRDDRDVRDISSELYNLQRNADRQRGR